MRLDSLQILGLPELSTDVLELVMQTSGRLPQTQTKFKGKFVIQAILWAGLLSKGQGQSNLLDHVWRGGVHNVD